MKLTKDELSVLAILASIGRQEFLDDQNCTKEQILIAAKTIENLVNKAYEAGKDKRRQGRTSIDGTGMKLARLAKKYGTSKREQAKIPFPNETVSSHEQGN